MPDCVFAVSGILHHIIAVAAWITGAAILLFEQRILSIRAVFIAIRLATNKNKYTCG